MTRIAILAATAAVFTLGAHAGGHVALADIDLDGDGMLSVTEFVGHKTASGDVTEADAMAAFVDIDADADGLISQAELDAAVKAHEEAASDKADMDMSDE